MRHLATLLLASALLWAQPLRAESAGAKFTEFAGFRLGQHNLADVQGRLGSAPIKHVGDAGDSEYSICYSVPGGSVRFMSGELGGNSHELLGFGISSHPPMQECAPWPASLPIPALHVSALRVGMTRSAFIRQIGRKVRWAGQMGQAFYHSVGSAGSVPTEVLITVEATFRANRLLSFTVWRTETT